MFFYQVIQSSVLSHTWRKVYEATTWKQKVKKSEEKSNSVSIISGELSLKTLKKVLPCYLVYTW